MMTINERKNTENDPTNTIFEAVTKFTETKSDQTPTKEQNEESYCLHQFINRKTFRGRKEKISLPKNEIKCEVCLEFSEFSNEKLISCSKCKCLFHPSCYGIDDLDMSEENVLSYKCERCTYASTVNQPINSFKCFICNNADGVLVHGSKKGEFCHTICINLINELKNGNSQSLVRENIRKWRYKNSCRYCGEKLSKSKAVIKCKNPKCKEYYHIPCAIEKGMIFNSKFMRRYYGLSKDTEIPFYCANHNKKLSLLYKNYVIKKKSDPSFPDIMELFPSQKDNISENEQKDLESNPSIEEYWNKEKSESQIDEQILDSYDEEEKSEENIDEASSEYCDVFKTNIDLLLKKSNIDEKTFFCNNSHFNIIKEIEENEMICNINECNEKSFFDEASFILPQLI